MAMKHMKGKINGIELSLRASISFPPELYRTLEDIARQKKVSLAWVMRDAAEKYVAEQTSPPQTRQRRAKTVMLRSA